MMHSIPRLILNRGMTGNEFDEFDTEPKKVKQKRVVRLVGHPPLQYSHQSAATMLKEALCFIPHLSLGLQDARGGRWSLVLGFLTARRKPTGEHNPMQSKS